MSLYAILGELFLILIIAVPILLLLAMIFGLMLTITKRKFFPMFTYTILTTFSQPAKFLLNILDIDPLILNEIIIALINSFTVDDYRSSAKDGRMLFLPQCLRSIECPAKTDAEEGIVCLECGKCEIAEIIPFAQKEGVEVYIVPGGGFVKRIIRKRKPEAVAGVACQIELYEMMQNLVRKGVPAQGVILAKSGCIETIVDWEKVRQILNA
ncbi:MAG: protein containing DUF116 [Candidatus Syntrophoarchaeum caldarius]|uniref:Protein containing DUF116 n=1 Tax=Candidatus Syntropharchaeum caldarium TaxID=1838285 RepID=A0A1F2PB62_9EURY|nr:MAG: protein containing DUF116 [Candidatus Syntrophoarchaeum caldarius]